MQTKDAASGTCDLLNPSVGIEAFMRRVSDIEHIKLLKARYCRYLDQQLWDEFSDLFTPDCMFEVQTRLPEQWIIFRPDGSRQECLPRDTWTAMVRRNLEHGGISAHHVHSPEITFQTDNEASGIWAMEDHLVMTAGKFYGWGYYEHRCARVNSVWKIAAWRLRWMHLEIL